MLNIRNLLRKIKKKYKGYKKDQSGGDMINQVFLLLIALIIIGMLLLFVITQFEKVKEGFLDLFDLSSSSNLENSTQIKQIKFKHFEFSHIIRKIYTDSLRTDGLNKISSLKENLPTKLLLKIPLLNILFNGESNLSIYKFF